MQNGKKKVLALLLAGCCVLSACGTKTDDTKTAEKGNFVTGTVECKEERDYPQHFSPDTGLTPDAPLQSHFQVHPSDRKIGRASCRERVCKQV